MKQEVRNPSTAMSSRKRCRKIAHQEVYTFYPGSQQSHDLSKTHFLDYWLISFHINIILLVGFVAVGEDNPLEYK